MTKADDTEAEARIKELNKRVMPHKGKAAAIAAEKERVKHLMVLE